MTFTNKEFKEKCMQDSQFLAKQKTRSTNLNFTELQCWEGASQGTEALNKKTNTWVLIFNPSM
jgi:hypothetical protein